MKDFLKNLGNRIVFGIFAGVLTLIFWALLNIIFIVVLSFRDWWITGNTHFLFEFEVFNFNSFIGRTTIILVIIGAWYGSKYIDDNY